MAKKRHKKRARKAADGDVGVGVGDVGRGHGNQHGQDPVRALVAVTPTTPGGAACNSNWLAQVGAVALGARVRLVSCVLERETAQTADRTTAWKGGRVALLASVEAVGGAGHGADKSNDTNDGNNDGNSNSNGNIIRALAFSPDGRYLAVGGDDKVLYVYQVTVDSEADDVSLSPPRLARSLVLLRAVRAPKKLSAVTWVDGVSVLAANKYGDVVCVRVDDGAQRELLGHFCSVVLGMRTWTSDADSDRKLLASVDRDGKVRVTRLEMGRLHDAGWNHRIESFCLGHVGYVGCAVFVRGGRGVTEGNGSGSGSGSEQVADVRLVTGGEDGVRVWDPMAGNEVGRAGERGRVLDMVALEAGDRDTQADDDKTELVAVVYDESGDVEDMLGLLRLDTSTSTSTSQHAITTIPHVFVDPPAPIRKISAVDAAGGLLWVVGAGDNNANTGCCEVGLSLVVIDALRPRPQRISLTIDEDVFSDMSVLLNPTDQLTAGWVKKSDDGGVITS